MPESEVDDGDATGMADLDPRAFESTGELYEAYEKASSRCPVARGTAYGGYYMLMGFEAVKEAANDWRRFSSAEGILLPQPPRPKAPPIEFDPPEHTEWRSVFRTLLSPRTRKALQEQVQAEAEALIDQFCEVGTAELVEAYTEPIPILAVASLIGLDPELAPTMRRLGLDVSNNHNSPAYGEVIAEFSRFALGEVEARRAAPREDFLTELGTAEFNGHRLSDEEIVGTLVSLMVAGHHSTVSAMSSLLQWVITRRDLGRTILGDRALLDRAIEETVRLNTPLHQFRRVATGDLDVDGVSIPRGSNVLLNYAAANRDPRQFADPDEFDLARPSPAHLGFGFGVHTCVGAPLARAEMRIAATTLLRRLPDIALDGDTSHVFHGQASLLDRLPVTFSPAGKTGPRS
ncbi:cytochrome P450 [Amycolatopsis endophytica]|uniref:Cytochrome P450 n=1 Tax=Amycolatopsis endophytica TaxID=860233 RepID=A0A853BCH5_9PSEU|nr:cytochrome P450 [Amycolatopsis endophytica]NYI92371.1 cytochrome P450 [Amycolatopsis endophytica]